MGEQIKAIVDENQEGAYDILNQNMLGEWANVLLNCWKKSGVT